MKNLSKLLAVVLTLIIVLCSCNKGTEKPENNVNSQTNSSEITSEQPADNDTTENSE